MASVILICVLPWVYEAPSLSFITLLVRVPRSMTSLILNPARVSCISLYCSSYLVACMTTPYSKARTASCGRCYYRHVFFHRFSRFNATSHVRVRRAMPANSERSLDRTGCSFPTLVCSTAPAVRDGDASLASFQPCILPHFQ